MVETVSVSEENLFERFSPESLRNRGTAKWTYFEPDVLAAWIAEMDFPAAPPVLAAITDAVNRQEFGYPARDADTGLPEVVAEWSKNVYGWAIDPARVHILPDVLRGVELAIEFFSEPESPVLLPTPAYMPFFEVPTVVNRRIVEVPLAVQDGRYSLDLDGIDRAFAGGAGIMILCQPYNPLGRAFTRDELQALSTVVARHGARVVSDEIHAPLTYGRSHVPYASVNDEAAAHTITVTSASKAWNLPGLKCAQLITSNAADEERWRGISMMKTHGASTIGIRATVPRQRHYW
jgi:cystathionine beta-lyase